MAYAEATPITQSAQTTVRVLAGWQFSENAGIPGAARVLLRDGSASGTVVADIRLASSTSTIQSFAHPVRLSDGVYVEVNAGTVRGAIYGVD